MDPAKPTELKEIFKEHDFYPKKSLGQNFLIDKNIINKIVKTASLSRKDNVIEVGAGVGTLANYLSQYSDQILAVEKDECLVGIMKDVLKDRENIKIVNEDILSFEVPFQEYKVVGNVPYYITSAIIRKFLEEKFPPSLMVLTVQKEVAERMMAKPPRMNLLSVSVQFYATPEIISKVSKNSFFPSPRVDSSIVKITPKEEPPSVDLRKRFFAVLRAGFSNPRKQLMNNLSSSLGINKEEVRSLLEEQGISPSKRAENLSVDDWTKLSKTLKI